MKKKLKKNKNSWLKIWEKKGTELKSSKIENLINASGFDSKFGEFNEKNWKRYIRAIFKNIKIKKNAEILEYGCGAGSFLSFWYGKNYKLSGVDYSKSLITKGKKYFPKINFRVGESLELQNFQSNFDLIISHSVFHYFRNYTYAKNLISNMLSKLKTTGIICILDVPDKDMEKSFKFKLKKELGNYEYKKKYKKTNHLFYKKSFFKDIAIENNLNIKIFKHSSKFNLNSKYRYNLILKFK